MSESLPIQPIGRFCSALRLPGSKSLTNRALLLAALSSQGGTLTGVLFADDTRVMIDALNAMGFALVVDEGSQRVVSPGCAQTISAEHVQLQLGNAGTAFRFLTAACCLNCGGSQYILDGNDRMRQRPIGQLVDALRQIGAKIDYLGSTGFPPLCVHSTGLKGGDLWMPTTLSSQFISALLMVGPACEQGLRIHFDGPITSHPYVQMTLELMKRFGVTTNVTPEFSSIQIQPAAYRGIDYSIEPDASNASYFLAAAAIVPASKCTIQGLGRGSLQGDVGFADVLHTMGAGLLFGDDFITVMGPPATQRLRGIDVDLNTMPDMSQTLAAVALFADQPTALRNIGNLRVKETDRLFALKTELGKLGAAVKIDGDDLMIEPPPNHAIRPAVIDTYDDHRMAMSFAIIGLRSPGIRINDPYCVRKTFPDYFEYLGKLGEASL